MISLNRPLKKLRGLHSSFLGLRLMSCFVPQAMVAHMPAFLHGAISLQFNKRIARVKTNLSAN
jgi:hypothetical protein